MTAARRVPLSERWAKSEEAPLWIRVALYAAAHADADGVATMSRGQLRREVARGRSAQAVSQAVKRAVRAGWLHPDSSAWSLRLGTEIGQRREP